MFVDMCIDKCHDMCLDMLDSGKATMAADDATRLDGVLKLLKTRSLYSY